jgi:UDP-N-acetylglucosamine:LPS N-acetylglucosamine transferase
MRSTAVSVPSGIARQTDDALTPAPHEPRILILSAAIGAGHDLPAQVLRDGLLEARPDAHVEIRDVLQEAGGLLERLGAQEAPLRNQRLQWLFDLEYRVLFRIAPLRRVVTWLITQLSRKTMRRLVAEARPDVIVSTYPGATEVIGRMRDANEIRVPVVSAITDLAALHLWAQSGIDLHLITHEESTEEVRAIAPRSRIAWVRGLTDARFDAPIDPQTARAALGLPGHGGVVLVSGGGWGVGDVAGAVETALTNPSVVRVLVLCGRSEALRSELQQRFGTRDDLVLLGFTDRMSELMAAADVLVHSTAGLTVLEAWIRGCRPVSYGWGVAHIRINNQAFERFGIAEVARDRDELRAAITRGLNAPRVPHPEYGELPRAADEVLALLER